MSQSLTDVLHVGQLPVQVGPEMWRPLLVAYHHEFVTRARNSLSFEDPADVHQARTRGRRLTTAMEMMTPTAPRDLSLSPETLASSIGAIMDLLSKPRDLDVLIPLVDSWRHVLRKSPLRKLLKRFVGFMTVRREKARQKMSRQLPQLLDERYLPEWEHFSETPLDASLHAINVGQILDQLQTHARGTFAQFHQVRAVLGLTHPESLRRLHAFRLHIKRVRYTLRLLQEFQPEVVSPAVAQAKELQTHMGAINDIRVMRKQFGKFLERSEGAKGLESAVTLFDHALEARLQMSLRQLDLIFANTLTPRPT